jgi:predicted lipoprotein
MTRIYKFIIGIIAIILVVYLSLDIQTIEKHRASSHAGNFDASDYAAKFWADSLPSSISNAPELIDLIKNLEENPENAIKKWGHKLGISKTDYFMVKGNGFIERVEDEFLIIALDNKTKIQIAIDFIYGNAIRDGSGKVNIDYFLNMTDFNNVSVAINKLAKEKVVTRLKKNGLRGKFVEFAGAMEISEENIDLTTLRIIPVLAKLSDGKSE